MVTSRKRIAALVQFADTVIMEVGVPVSGRTVGVASILQLVSVGASVAVTKFG